jgi:prevent-host-death family protein
MTRLSATEVARNFSEVVNRVGAGEEVEVVRNGIPVMQLRPPKPAQVLPIARWRELLAGAPGVDGEFKEDVEAARKRLEPPRSAWPS